MAAASKLPQQIQRQIDEANRLAESFRAKDGEEETEVKAEETEEAAPSNEAKEKPSAELSFDSSSEAQDVETDSGGEEDREDGEASDDDEGMDAHSSQDEYEHKYKTLQGMFNSEKRRNAELAGRIEGLENMLARLQELRQESSEDQKTQEKAQDKAVKQLLTQEEIDDYGSDLIDVMKRAAREAVQDEISSLREENQQLKQVIGGVGQRQDMTEREKFYAQLETRVDNWKSINRDPDFLQWLEELDVYAGEPRKALLMKAFDRSDAERVARFFTGYLDENAAVQKATTSPRSQTSSKENGRGKKVDLASLAAPGEGASGSADNTDVSSSRMWKASEIGAFYANVRKGKYKGRDDDYRRIETQIQTAMNEGRILVGQ